MTKRPPKKGKFQYSRVRKKLYSSGFENSGGIFLLEYRKKRAIEKVIETGDNTPVFFCLLKQRGVKERHHTWTAPGGCPIYRNFKKYFYKLG